MGARRLSICFHADCDVRIIPQAFVGYASLTLSRLFRSV